MPSSKTSAAAPAPVRTFNVSFRALPGAQLYRLPRGLRPDEDIVATNAVVNDLVQYPGDNLHRRWERCRGVEVSPGMPLDRALYRDRGGCQVSDFEIIVRIVQDALARRAELAAQLAALDAAGAAMSLPLGAEVPR